MLYNYPGRMGVDMGEEYFDRVGRVAERSAPSRRARATSTGCTCWRASTRTSRCSCGMDDQALEFFAWGASSWVCGGVQLPARRAPRAVQACVVEGDFDKGRRIMSAMLPLMWVLEQGGKFVQSIKYGLRAGGACPAGRRGRRCGRSNKDDKRELEQVVGTLRRTVAAIEAITAERNQ